MSKRKHWTQTARGRARMRRILKDRFAAKLQMRFPREAEAKDNIVKAEPINTIAVSPLDEIHKQCNAYWNHLSLGDKLFALARFLGAE